MILKDEFTTKAWIAINSYSGYIYNSTLSLYIEDCKVKFNKLITRQHEDYLLVTRNNKSIEMVKKHNIKFIMIEISEVSGVATYGI